MPIKAGVVGDERMRALLATRRRQASLTPPEAVATLGREPGSIVLSSWKNRQQTIQREEAHDANPNGFGDRGRFDARDLVDPGGGTRSQAGREAGRCKTPR